MEDIIDLLREKNEPIPVPLDLPDEDLLVEIEEELLMPLPDDLREYLLQASDEQRQTRADEMVSLVAASSWDRSASSVHALISASREAALIARESPATAAAPAGQGAAPAPRYAVAAVRS